MMRRTDDGAVKCALRDFRREEETAFDCFIFPRIGDGGGRALNGNAHKGRRQSDGMCNKSRSTPALGIDVVGEIKH